MSDAHLYLAIPQPCHEDWAHMTPTARGRFCQACCKEVLDFSTMDPASILQVVQQAPEGSVCGRIPAQVLLESRWQAEAAAQGPPAPWLRRARQWLAAVGLPLLAYSPLLARPAVAESPVAQAAPLARSRPTTLQLRIYDPATGQGLGFAAVQLWLADSLLLSTQAEADGTLQLALPHQGAVLSLLVQVPGYQAAEEVLRAGAPYGTLAIPLQRGATELPVVRKEANAPQERRTIMGGAVSAIRVVEVPTRRWVLPMPKWRFWRRAAKSASVPEQ